MVSEICGGTQRRSRAGDLHMDHTIEAFEALLLLLRGLSRDGRGRRPWELAFVANDRRHSESESACERYENESSREGAIRSTTNLQFDDRSQRSRLCEIAHPAF